MIVFVLKNDSTQLILVLFDFLGFVNWPTKVCLCRIKYPVTEFNFELILELWGPSTLKILIPLFYFYHITACFANKGFLIPI